MGYWDLREDIEALLGEREMIMTNAVESKQSMETRREVSARGYAGGWDL
jgi:hypothetical protein